MSFLEDTIITEIYLKSKIVLKSEILKNYSEGIQLDEENPIIFNLVKFVTQPFPGFVLYMRKFLGDEDSELPDIEEKYTGFIIAGDVSFLKLMEASDLKESDKSLLLIED